MIYIFNYIASILIIFFLKNKKQILIWFIFLWIFGGIRWNTGYDFQSYFDDYSLIKLGYNTGREYLLTKIAQISPNYSVYLSIILFCSLYFKGKAIGKYSPLIGLSTFIYYTTSYIYDDLGRIRIGLATSIAYYFLYKIIEKKSKFYILLILALGILIHSSILLMLIIPFIYKLKMNRKILISVLIIAVILGFLLTPKTISKIIEEIEYLKLPIISNSNLTNLYEATPRKASIRDIYFIFISSFLIYKYSYLKDKYLYFKIIFLTYFWGIIIFFIFRNIIILSTRGSEVMLASEFLLIPYLVKDLKIINKFIAIILIIIYSGYIYFTMVMKQPYYPYINILF